jgi:CHAD domain-containing protein
MPYALAAARLLEVRAAELREHARDVLDISDIERVHDMRVATRRLRAALEVFEPCFPRKRYKAALRDIKALADALGERRDRDVTIAELERVAAGLAAADRPGVESLIEELRAEQGTANEALAPFISAERLAALGRVLEELIDNARRLGDGAFTVEPSPDGLAVASAGDGSGVAATR